MRKAWNRVDFHRRQNAHCFWYLLAALEGDSGLAENRRNKALEEARTELDQSILQKIDWLLSVS